MVKSNIVYVIAGPTASGKTGIAYEFCRKYGGEVVSCDSMQIYNGMDIGTAKPSVDYLNSVKHHLIGFLSPHEHYSAASYKSDAYKVIEDILKRDKIPVVSGGTGLYLNSLIYNIQFSENADDPALKAQIDTFISSNSPEALYSFLLSKAPDAAQNIHPNNIKRIRRAVEIYLNDSSHQISGTFSRNQTPPYDFRIFILSPERELLYERINRRVDEMITLGLVEETIMLRKSGFSDSQTASQAIGYKEIMLYLDGMCDLSEAVNLIKQHTRNYAKRQITWFKKIKEAHHIDPDAQSPEETADLIYRIGSL